MVFQYCSKCHYCLCLAFTPPAADRGEVQLPRWQRIGVGRTLPVIRPFHQFYRETIVYISVNMIVMRNIHARSATRHENVHCSNENDDPYRKFTIVGRKIYV